MAGSRVNTGSGHGPVARLDSRQEALPELTATEQLLTSEDVTATLVPAVLIPSRLRPAPSRPLRLARERDPPEPDPLTALLGRSGAARGDSWSEQYDCCSDNSDDTGSQQSHGIPPRLVSPIADPLLSLPEDAMPTRARRAATGPFVPERAAAEHPCRRAVCACRRRGPRLRAATRTEGSASPVRVSPWPNPVTRADQGLQDAAVVCRASSRARSRRATGRETAPSVVATGSLAATLERSMQDDLRRHSGPAPVEPGTWGSG